MWHVLEVGKLNAEFVRKASKSVAYLRRVMRLDISVTWRRIARGAAQPASLHADIGGVIPIPRTPSASVTI